MIWDIRLDFTWCLKLYRGEQFLAEVEMEFHVLGKL